VTSEPLVDGRSARSKRTRLAVVDALLDLVRAGNTRPTARQIAARAGVSLRSVYVHFDDLEDLFVAAARRQLELVSGMMVAVPTHGPIRDRAEVLMRMRGRIHESVGPVRHAAELQESRSPAVAQLLGRLRRAARAEVARTFAAELDPLPDDARARRLAALDVLAGPATWQDMRTTGRLDVAATRRAVIEAMIAVLQPPQSTEPAS
jgi:TetR/AcrR family transcriptional regulator, regulator of autoinduction and epiphytic fitness